THTSTLTSVDGCDSIIVTTLTVNPTYNLNETASICQGQTYTYPDGSTGTVTETHTSLLASVDGCDSIIVTNLTVNPTYNLNETASICQGQTYTYPDGSTGTVTETHTSVLTSVDGCDSIIVTNLTVNPTYNMNETASICQGQTYTYPDGATGTITETHTSVLTSVDGCDSIIVTNLTVNPTYNMNETVSICQGETYTYPDGSTGTVSEVHTSLLTSVDGCDSTIITTLDVIIVDNTVTVNGSTLEANATGATYQWVVCDNELAAIDGATNQTFTPSSGAGNYAVIVTEGSCVDTSDCILLDPTGLENVDPYNISIYPNPTTEDLHISWNGTISFVRITDARGRLLYELNVQNTKSIDINVGLYEDGVYFIHLYTDDGIVVKDVIKQ
ncbi:MAG: T9SS type A sorting domain-containing protein, partial [Crocinitomicaceae bacterium]|nr:T9SS type A sorting domain-containing protein [Crocinitomicaceae bacterium]